MSSTNAVVYADLLYPHVKWSPTLLDYSSHCTSCCTSLMAFTETEPVVCIHLLFAKIEVDPSALPIHGLAYPRSVHIDCCLAPEHKSAVD